MESSKYDVCLEELSKQLLQTPIGEKTLTISDFCEDTQFARGTVQAAYATVRMSESILVNPRGRLGTFVEKKNYKKLFRYANIHYLNVSSPLPYSLNHIGLNMGIKKNIEASLFVPVLFTHTRSVVDRLHDLVNKKSQIAILSKYVALQAQINNQPIKLVTELGSFTTTKCEERYPIENQIIEERNIDIGLKKYAYNMQELLTILDQEEIKTEFKIKSLDINNPHLYEQVLVIHESDNYLEQVLSEIMDIEDILATKSSIIDGNIHNISF